MGRQILWKLAGILRVLVEGVEPFGIGCDREPIFEGNFPIRVAVHWVLVIGLCCAGLFAQEVRRASSTDSLPQGPTFEIKKFADLPQPLCPGSTITYQVTLTNQSGQATVDLPASINDPIPAGTTYVVGSATNGALFTPPSPSAGPRGSVTWSGTLGGRQFPASRTIAFAVTVNPGVADDTQITNVATGTLFLPNQSLLQRQVALPINVDCPPPPITFTLNKNRAFSRPLCPGSNIAYSVRLDNTSQRGNLLDYSIEDAIPPSTTFAGGITGGGVFDSAMDKITWTGSLGPGETRFFGFSVTVDTVPDQTLIRNRATATLSDPQIGDSKTGEVEVQDGVDCPRPTGPLTWTGAENSDLCNPNNFEPAFEPGPDDDVIIPANSPLAILSQPKQLRSVTVGAGSILRIEGGSLSLRDASTVDGILVNGVVIDPTSAPAIQGGVSGSLTIQGDVSGTGKIRNFAQLILSSINLNVELETDGTVEFDGLVNLTKPVREPGELLV